MVKRDPPGPTAAVSGILLDDRKGLPQENAFDITFRHALDIRGDRLALGTTSGNLFLSDDGGDSWQCLENYLPPVYSVRFA